MRLVIAAKDVISWGQCTGQSGCQGLNSRWRAVLFEFPRTPRNSMHRYHELERATVVSCQRPEEEYEEDEVPEVMFAARDAARVTAVSAVGRC